MWTPCTETSIKNQPLYAAIWAPRRLEVQWPRAAVTFGPHAAFDLEIVFVEVGRHVVWFPDLEKGRHRK